MKGPTDYVFGAPGARVVVVPGNVAAWLSRYAKLSETRERFAPSDPEVAAVVTALLLAGRDYVQHGSVGGTVRAPRAEPEPASTVRVGTRAAAARLGLGERAVRRALAEGRLTGQQIDGRWQVDSSSIDDYARRAA